MPDPNVFRDLSCKPIGERLSYERGDGKQMELQMNKPHHAKARATVVVPHGVPITINPAAGINATQLKRPASKPAQIEFSIPQNIPDHPAVGGKVTIFVLFYGDYFDLHQRCLRSLLATVPASRMELRVGSNMLGARSLELINQYVAAGVITCHYQHDENAYKYPVMREMFWDPGHPITTKWVLWFDDDSICDADQNWFNILSTHIAQHHKDKDAHLIGASYTWDANKKQREVFMSRPWYKNRPWRDANGRPSPNGSTIVFVHGGFWAITAEAIREANIPDLGTGLLHTGGDWQIGEQVYQAGFGMKQFNGKKQFVRTSSVARRGATTPTVDQVTQPVIIPAAKPIIHVPILEIKQAALQKNDPPIVLKPIVRP